MINFEPQGVDQRDKLIALYAEMERALISVVVPIYNVEEYLRQCIETIITQTYSNLEIILVDDG